MELMSLLKERQLSVYQCAKESHVPYTTLSDIVKGKTRIEKCTVETIYKLARTLHVTMEELLTDFFNEDANAPNLRDFEIYKSNICHLVKDKGDIDFIIDSLKENQIRTYWERQWYRESFYLLAMVDYLSRENELPLCNDYEDIRNCKLSEPLYPKDIILATKLDDAVITASSAMKEAVNTVGDRLGLPNGWLNADFKNTSSYSPKLSQYSKYYRTYSNVLNIRTISAEYLVAMKLMSGRRYKKDLSDIIGILSEQERR